MSELLQTVIGLEIHTELNTKSKLFCSCANRFSAPPNTLCCPVCLGLPGALPVLNHTAALYAVRLGLALSCQINAVSHFERKHYVYPDLPKGYQITQLNQPIAENGILFYILDGVKHHVEIERIQIEEDAGKTVVTKDGMTLLDYNRCGVPLLEIVTKPQIDSAEKAKACLEAMACLLKYLDISDVKMQEGSLRADVNVSVHSAHDTKLGQRCEMKNINSFSAVYHSILHEEQRQKLLLEQGYTIKQETRHWDEKQKNSTLLRSKEDQGEYRFIQEPDLMPLCIPKSEQEEQRKFLPELPVDKWQRYQTDLNVSEKQAFLLISNKAQALFFENAFAEHNIERLSQWVTGPLKMVMRERNLNWQTLAITPAQFSELVSMVEEGAVSATIAKQLLYEMVQNGKNAMQLAKEKGVLQTQDESLLSNFVKEVLCENPLVVQDFENGKTKAADFLLGKAMQKSGGCAHPKKMRQILLFQLSEKSNLTPCEDRKKMI